MVSTLWKDGGMLSTLLEDEGVVSTLWEDASVLSTLLEDEGVVSTLWEDEGVLSTLLEDEGVVSTLWDVGVWQFPKFWPCGLVGYSACLVNRRSPVRIRSGPIFYFILFRNLPKFLR